MKKCAIMLVAAVLAAVLLATGCGGSSTTSKSQPKGKIRAENGMTAKQILDKANDKMEGVVSVQLKGDTVIKTLSSDKDDAVAKKEETRFQIGADESNPLDPQASIQIQVIGIGKKQRSMSFPIYITNGYVYMFVPKEMNVEEQGWVKMPIEDMGTVGEANPSDNLRRYSASPQNLRIVSEDNTHYVLHFTVSKETLQKMLKEGMDQKVSPDDQALMENMLGVTGIDVTYSVLKDSWLINWLRTRAKMSVPDYGDSTVDTTMSFWDYNKPVVVTLPSDAQNAKEVAQPPASLLTIPGFSL